MAGESHESLRVADAMTQAVMFLDVKHTLVEAWDAFHRHSVNGAPVLGERGRLVGIVTTSDLADPRRRPDPTTRVGDVMTKVVYAVRATDPLLNAALLMVDNSIHHVVVVNDDGSIAGIVSPMDVLRVVYGRGDPARERRDGPTPPYVDLRSLP
ncbi:MAG TPA: CBS domain-containing protein [Polyangiaceae bacterium]|nr:CBS domain-containing protein [Polyangiaceae bacterium]